MDARDKIQKEFGNIPFAVPVQNKVQFNFKRIFLFLHNMIINLFITKELNEQKSGSKHSGADTHLGGGISQNATCRGLA